MKNERGFVKGITETGGIVKGKRRRRSKRTLRLRNKFPVKGWPLMNHFHGGNRIASSAPPARNGSCLQMLKPLRKLRVKLIDIIATRVLNTSGKRSDNSDFPCRRGNLLGSL